MAKRRRVYVSLHRLFLDKKWEELVRRVKRRKTKVMVGPRTLFVHASLVCPPVPIEVMDVFIEHSDLSVVRNGQCAVQWATDPDLLDLLCSKKYNLDVDARGSLASFTILKKAVSNNDSDLVVAALRNGANPYLTFPRTEEEGFGDSYIFMISSMELAGEEWRGLDKLANMMEICYLLVILLKSDKLPTELWRQLRTFFIL